MFALMLVAFAVLMFIAGVTFVVKGSLLGGVLAIVIGIMCLLPLYPKGPQFPRS